MTTASFIRCASFTFVAALTLPACGWKSPDENVLHVDSRRVPADGSRSYAIVEMPGMFRTVSPEQLSAGAEFAVRGKGGKLVVKFVRILGTADTIARAQISFDIVKGYTYYTGFTRRPSGTPLDCIGCSGTVAFPMIGSLSNSTDSVHIDYVYGEPLCKGCITKGKTLERTVLARKD